MYLYFPDTLRTFMFEVRTLSRPVSLLFNDALTTTQLYAAEGQGKTASGDSREDVAATRSTENSKEHHKKTSKYCSGPKFDPGNPLRQGARS